MKESMIKTCIAALVYSLTFQNFLSLISSIVVIVYFVSMLKMNVVNRKYNNSWWLFIKSIFKTK